MSKIATIISGQNYLVRHFIRYKKQHNYYLVGNSIRKEIELEEKTSMMWPSQNVLLYNGTVIKIQVKTSELLLKYK